MDIELSSDESTPIPIETPREEYNIVEVKEDEDIVLSPPSSPLLTLPRVILRYHPDEPYLPASIDGKVDCTYNQSKFTLSGVEYNKIEYAFNYTDNGAIGFGWWCFPMSECLGYHKGDRERLMLLLDYSGNIKWVYFNAHSPGQGVWRRWEDTRRTKEGTLIAYVERASHANYPEDGSWTRCGCFANDLCSDDGPAFEINPTGTHDDAINPKQASITLWERFWLCCYADYLRNDTP